MSSDKCALECSCGWTANVDADNIETAKENHYEWAAENSPQQSHRVRVQGEL